MKQFVPGQRGTGMCCCQEATKQEPLRPLALARPGPLPPSGNAPTPQVSGYSQGMQTLAPDPAWPNLLLRMSPIHPGPREKAQSRTEQAAPTLITAG